MGDEMRRPDSSATDVVAEGEDIARLLRLAGPRPGGPADRMARVRQATHASWREAVAARSARRRRLGLTLGALAAATAIALGVRLGDRPDGTRVVPGLSPVAVASLVWATGPVEHFAAEATRDAPGRLRVGSVVNPGTRVRTGRHARAAFLLAGGIDLRVDTDTELQLLAPREVVLARGAVFASTDRAQEGGELRVHTPLGVVRNVGTRFEVRLAERGVRLRVRGGRVVLEQSTTRHEAPAATELLVREDGSAARRAIPVHGEAWDWVARAAPSFELDGRTLEAFLAWVEREGSWHVRLADQRLARSASGTFLHGSIDQLTPEEALSVVLPTCGLTHRIEGDTVVITRDGAAGRGDR